MKLKHFHRMCIDCVMIYIRMYKPSFYYRKLSKLFRNDKRDTITTVIQCFGGGLLLGTALILILPEVSLSNQSNFDSSYIQPYYYETSVLGQPNPQ